MAEKDDSGYAQGFPRGDLLLAVRKDTNTTLASADSRFTPLQVDANGCLYVCAVGGSGSTSITSVVPGTGAANLGKAEDAAHTSGDVGVMALAVRKATPANVSDTDADYEPLQVSAGRLWTSAKIDTDTTSAIAATGRNSDIDTAAEQLTTTSIPTVKGVVVKADPSNTGTVYVGTSTVTVAASDATDGYPLTPGETVTIPIDNANKIYVIASANNQIAHYLAL